VDERPAPDTRHMTNEHDHASAIVRHYAANWGGSARERRWPRGPIDQLPSTFRVLEYERSSLRGAVRYATVGMSSGMDRDQLELHLMAHRCCDSIVELLTAVAHYHRHGASLGLGHIVNFGRPWQPRSACEHGLVSLPYVDGPSLERCVLPGGMVVRCLWLIPITAAERTFALEHGIGALEQRFEETQFSYLNPQRESVV
jgi:hypothetical protein